MGRVEGARPRTLHAVIVVPGIMGSELVNRAGKVVWGLDPGPLARALVTRQLAVLHPREEELGGHPRLRPTRLVRVPSFLPFLGGLEPYSAIVESAASVAVDDRAVKEFPYDWRLSIAYNAALLVRAAEAHHAWWRGVVAKERLGDLEDVGLLVVAHSMGGLVARYAATVLGLDAILTGVITAGTPYFGSVKAVEVMSTGRLGFPLPLPRKAVRNLARLCPSMYDLLPRYRCLSQDSPRARVLEPSDVAAVGGSADLARDAADRWERLGLRERDSEGTPWSRVKALIGKEQPTVQSAAIRHGAFEFINCLEGTNHSGDSTVYSGAAAPIGVTSDALPQKHGSLLKDATALTMIQNWLLGRVTGPPLGTRPIGADIPDLVPAGARPVVSVTGTQGSSVGVSVKSTDLVSKKTKRWSSGKKAGETVRFEGPVLRPGLHRVQVKAGGFPAVTDTLMVFAEQRE